MPSNPNVHRDRKRSTRFLLVEQVVREFGEESLNELFSHWTRSQLRYYANRVRLLLIEENV